MRKLILFALVAVVMVAGCTGQTLGDQGGDTIEEADVIVATNEPVIPSQPAAGTDFTARFTVKNQHKANRAENVGAWIYDTGKCAVLFINGVEVTKDTPVNGLLPGLPVTDGKLMTFMPGQQELIKLILKAPSSESIGGLPYSCPIRYNVNYDFTAKSSMMFDVMSTTRFEQLEAQTGERPVYTRTLNVGAGPIRVILEPISTLPVEAGRKTFRFEMTVKNEGTGDYAKIKKGELVLRIPEEFEVEDETSACGAFFARDVSLETTGTMAFTNSLRTIDLIEKQSSPIICEFKTPLATAVPVEKKYSISTEMKYSYSYYGEEISVPITP